MCFSAESVGRTSLEKEIGISQLGTTLLPATFKVRVTTNIIRIISTVLLLPLQKTLACIPTNSLLDLFFFRIFDRLEISKLKV